MVHLDYVKSMLEREVQGGIKVVGFLDSPVDRHAALQQQWICRIRC